MRHSHPVPRWGCWSALVGLSLVWTLTGCASWTNQAKPSSAFPDDAAACKAEAEQAPVSSGQFDDENMTIEVYSNEVAWIAR